MNIFAKIYCRIFQTAFRMALPVLPYREPEIIRSCAEIGKVAKKEKISSVLIVTDKGIVNNGLVDPVEAALQASGVSYCIYADNLFSAATPYLHHRCRCTHTRGGSLYWSVNKQGNPQTVPGGDKACF